MAWLALGIACGGVLYKGAFLTWRYSEIDLGPVDRIPEHMRIRLWSTDFTALAVGVKRGFSETTY